MMYMRRIGFTMVALAAGLATGCGGGGGGGSSSSGSGIDRGGITIAQGPISGFGSVIVNGVHYSTSGATITVDDQPGSESELRVGYVVRIEGTLDASGTTGTAKTISFNDNVEGPVQSIDLVASRLVVLGQIVQVGPATSFDDSIVPRDLGGLLVGDRVEVSGLVGSDGVIAATRIERKGAAGTVEVRGVASGVDNAAHRLQINGLTVDYSSAQLSGFASGQPANGDVIGAKGTVDGSGMLNATQLEKRSDSLPGTPNDKAELEGLVTRFVSATDFDVAGQRVTTTAATVYEHGTVADIALDAGIEVSGTFDTSGRIVAQKFEFRLSSDLELVGSVESVNAAANLLTVLGQSIRTTAETRFEDHSAADIQRFSLNDLNVGDIVEVRGYRDGATIVATLLEREDAAGGGSEVEVKGPATNVVPPNLTVAGVSVTTTDAPPTPTEFRDKNGVSISAAAFFTAAPGREVKVRGTTVGNTVLATRAELED
jgi:hypothetical protein